MKRNVTKDVEVASLIVITIIHRTKIHKTLQSNDYWGVTDIYNKRNMKRILLTIIQPKIKLELRRTL